MPKKAIKKTPAALAAVEPTTTANTPDWLKNVIANSQSKQDAKDAENLRYFNSASAEWIENNIRNRENGNAITTPPALPTVTTFYDGGGHMEQRTVPNPAAIPPVLPPPVISTAPNIPGMGGSGGDARDNMMFDLLIAIQRDVSIVKKAIVG